MQKHHPPRNGIAAYALWRRLDTPGHDAACLVRSETGHVLMGTAVFLHDEGPACIDYTVTVDADWNTTEGDIYGFAAGRTVRHGISRDETGWMLDGRPVPGIGHLRDLDLGFTPATNLLQLKRNGPAIGKRSEFDVAWFDIGRHTLAALPQVYVRRDANSYHYAAATIPYEAVLDIAANGFVKNYPRLWAMEV
jgi:hypothetical protein